jgi:hypothetical protein
MQKIGKEYGLDFDVEIAALRKHDEKITLKQLEEELMKEGKL